MKESSDRRMEAAVAKCGREEGSRGGGGDGSDCRGYNSDDGDGGFGSGVTVLSLAQGLGLEFVPLSALQFLDAPDIARCGAANRFMYKAAGDEGVWRAARDRLWERKVFVPQSSRAMSSAKAGYIDSLRDSLRTWLEPEELTSFCWWFRFKQQAGEAWTAQDPWYRNEKRGKCRKKKNSCVDFPLCDPGWSVDLPERCRVSLWRPLALGSDGGLQGRPHSSTPWRHVAPARGTNSGEQQPQQHQHIRPTSRLITPPPPRFLECSSNQASISWQFVDRAGRRTGPTGSFLRVRIGGRAVPTYIVSRHPSNWGFLLESCWTLYTSWEMPPRDGPDCDRSLLDDELTVTMDDQWEEVR
ncbi:unnamed protein product, partial [Pylaiella littoralis]